VVDAGVENVVDDTAAAPRPLNATTLDAWLREAKASFRRTSSLQLCSQFVADSHRWSDIAKLPSRAGNSEQ